MKHAVTIALIILVLYFVPLVYQAYLRHVEFPALRAHADPPQIHEYGSYQPVSRYAVPDEYTFVIVTRTNGVVKEEFYGKGGLTAEVNSREGHMVHAHWRNRGAIVQSIPAMGAILVLMGVSVGRMLAPHRTRELRAWEKKLLLYCGAVFLSTLVFMWTGLWSFEP
jgi:hypothetical protein